MDLLRAFQDKGFLKCGSSFFALLFLSKMGLSNLLSMLLKLNVDPRRPFLGWVVVVVVVTKYGSWTEPEPGPVNSTRGWDLSVLGSERLRSNIAWFSRTSKLSLSYRSNKLLCSSPNLLITAISPVKALAVTASETKQAMLFKSMCKLFKSHYQSCPEKLGRS